MAENWKDILKAQNEDLARLETMDAELNTKKSATSATRRTSIGAESLLARKKAAPGASTSPRTSPAPIAAFTVHEDHYSFGDIYGIDGVQKATEGDEQDEMPEPESASSPVQQETEKAPETNDRYLKAKVKLQTKQLEAANELKLRMEEETRDLQRQLKQERENNKQQKSRIQQLEVELKKSFNSKNKLGAGAGRTGDKADDYRSEIAGLRKDVETAQRIAKNAESASKTKDIQLKRAAESMARLKTQLEELQLVNKDGSSGDTEKLEIAQSRIKVLEKQRTELMEGFRKQMKLIDVLKRQKVHMEAARLLAFTEEEFMKTLDWKL